MPGYDLNEKVGEAIVKHQWMGEDPSTTTIQAVVSRLLSDSYFQEYEPFASTRYSQTHPAEHVKNVLPTEHLSLEMVHNNIHEWSGGSQRDDAGVPTQGHMANVPVSSFDPVFWMHHWYDSPPSILKPGSSRLIVFQQRGSSPSDLAVPQPR